MKFDMPTCGGCRTCELVCSYHHLGAFVPAASSMKILEKKEGSGYLVSLKEEADTSGPACDGCEGLDVPWCLEYCREMDDLYKILQEFDAKRTKKSAMLKEGALDDRK
jgi:Fe-S-cluster-containing hydrogenase component 2